MAKGAYIGVGGKARKIKNIYIGTDRTELSQTVFNNTSGFLPNQDVTLSVVNGKLKCTSDITNPSTPGVRLATTYPAGKYYIEVTVNSTVKGESLYLYAGTSSLTSIDSIVFDGSNQTLSGEVEMTSSGTFWILFSGVNAGDWFFITKIQLKRVSMAKKVKKAYIGVNGKARLFFGGGDIKYLKQVDYNGRASPSVGTVGEYAVFTNEMRGYADTYNNALVRFITEIPDDKAPIRPGDKGVTMGNLLLHAPCSSGTRGNKTLVLNNSLTVLSSPDIPYSVRSAQKATNGNQFILMIKGNKVDDEGCAISSSMIKTNIDELTNEVPNYEMRGANVGNYAVFGGYDNNLVVNQSLTVSKSNGLAINYGGGIDVTAFPFQDYAVFVAPDRTIGRVNKSLTVSKLSAPNIGLDYSSDGKASNVIQDKIILGAWNMTSAAVLNDSFTHEKTITGIPTIEYGSACANENYMIFAGDWDRALASVLEYK